MTVPPRLHGAPPRCTQQIRRRVERLQRVFYCRERYLAYGRIPEAREKVDQAAKVAFETHNRKLALSAAVAGARVRASSRDGKDVRDALATLKNLLGTSGAPTFAEELYEARLALGEIEIKSADTAVGRSYLEGLQKDASGQGFQLIARKASAVLEQARNQAALPVQN